MFLLNPVYTTKKHAHTTMSIIIILRIAIVTAS